MSLSASQTILVHKPTSEKKRGEGQLKPDSIQSIAIDKPIAMSSDEEENQADHTGTTFISEDWGDDSIDEEIGGGEDSCVEESGGNCHPHSTKRLQKSAMKIKQAGTMLILSLKTPRTNS